MLICNSFFLAFPIKILILRSIKKTSTSLFAKQETPIVKRNFLFELLLESYFKK